MSGALLEEDLPHSSTGEGEKQPERKRRSKRQELKSPSVKT